MVWICTPGHEQGKMLLRQRWTLGCRESAGRPQGLESSPTD